MNDYEVLGVLPAPSEAAPAWSAPTSRQPRPDECQMCGSAPAEVFAFTRQTAKVVYATVYRQNLTLCRMCALSLGRTAQNRTMVTGWWGMISFLTNAFHVVKNGSGLKRAGEMEAPRRDPMVVSPRSTPLDPGRSMLSRGGTWFGAAVLVGTLVVGVAVVRDRSGSNSPSTPAASWEVGACLSAGGPSVKPVPCSGPHGGRIVSFAAAPNRCPASAEQFVTEPNGVWCIDEAG